MKFLTSMFVHEKRWFKLLSTFCARMRFLTRLSLFIEKLPKFFVTFFARISFFICCTIWSLSFTQTSCHMLCMDEASHQCEFVHETILVELLSHSLQGRGSSPVSLFIEKNIPIPKLFVTCFAWMRFLTSLSLLMRKITQTFVTFFARISFFTCCTIHL